MSFLTPTSPRLRRAGKGALTDKQIPGTINTDRKMKNSIKKRTLSMTHQKAFISIKSLFLTAIIALSPTLQAFELPAPVKNAKIYAQQRAKFAKVMASAIARHVWQNGQLAHTKIEEMLGQIYGPGLPATPDNIQADVEALCQAIENNPSTDIAPEDFLLGASSSAYQI